MKLLTAHTLLFLLIGNCLFSQDSLFQNTSSQIIDSDKKLSIRSYAQIDFNQPYSSDIRYNAKAEIHRMILFFGYKFDDKLQFISEIEIEHGNELFLEQAFTSYKFSPSAQLRVGLMLIPMGIINEYHEPTIFNGVERPNVDKFLVPTTWRELGIGMTGILGNSGFRYQAYIFNGFKSYDDGGLIRGIDGLRKGRQKGLKSTMSSPNLSLKLDYFGVRNLKIGLAGYFGKTQSTLFNGLVKNHEALLAQANNSVVGISMIGIDARYGAGNLELKAQFITTSIDGSNEYNELTGKDLGSQMTGLLVEIGYNILPLLTDNSEKAFVPFVRYEKYNTHADTDGIEVNKRYDRTDFTIGLTYRHMRAVSFKLDHQWMSNELNDDVVTTFNAGIGVWF